MNKKGFTLIELLAIIVILAIIAVITVPIILNIIENARKGAAKNSAYGYKDAIDKYYLGKLFDDQDFALNGSYDVLDGKLKGSGLSSSGEDILVSGVKPSSGTLEYENSILKNGCLKIDNYAVTFVDGEVSTAELGDCSSVMLVSVPYSFTRVVDGVSYTSASDIKSNPIYYNPTSGSACTVSEYLSNDPTPVTGVYKKSGCMKWFAYSKNGDGTVNLLLDHNTTANVAWVANSTDYSNGSSVGISYYHSLPDWGSYGANYSGPVTALNQLKVDTNSWSDVLLRSDSYELDGIGYNDMIHYMISYAGYKARLITPQEVAAIGNVSYNFGNYQINFTENNLAEGQTSIYSWLFDYTDSFCSYYGCANVANSDNSTDGYYTSSASFYSCFYVQQWAGYNDEGDVSSTFLGIRPVITVDASTL